MTNNLLFQNTIQKLLHIVQGKITKPLVLYIKSYT